MAGEEDRPTLDEVGNLFEPVEAEASPMPVEDLEVVRPGPAAIIGARNSITYEGVELSLGSTSEPCVLRASQQGWRSAEASRGAWIV